MDTTNDDARPAGLGPFFALERIAELTGPWRSMAELDRNSDGFARRAEQVRGALSTMSGGQPVPTRVAASVAHLGLVARLVSPVLGAVLIQGRLPTYRLDELAWQAEPGGAFPLATWVEPTYGTSDDPAAELSTWIATGPIAEITAGARAYGVSSHIVGGNVASALHAGAGVAVRARPELAAAARSVTDTVLGRAPLAGRHTVDGQGRFRRTNCCLIYQLGSGRTGVCGDCVLEPA